MSSGLFELVLSNFQICDFDNCDNAAMFKYDNSLQCPTCLFKSYPEEIKCSMCNVSMGIILDTDESPTVKICNSCVGSVKHHINARWKDAEQSEELLAHKFRIKRKKFDEQVKNINIF